MGLTDDSDHEAGTSQAAHGHASGAPAAANPGPEMGHGSAADGDPSPSTVPIESDEDPDPDAPEPMESVRHNSTVRFPPGFSMTGAAAVEKVVDFNTSCRQTLKLTTFSNKPTEDVRLWLHAIQYKFNVPGDIAQYAHLDSNEDFNAPLCHVTLSHLQGDPARFCSELPQDMIVCFRKLSALLIDRFARPTLSLSERRKKTGTAIVTLSQGTKSLTDYILYTKEIRYHCMNDQLPGLKEAFIDGLSDTDPYSIVIEARLRDTAESKHVDDMLEDLIKHMRDKYRPDQRKAASFLAPAAVAVAPVTGTPPTAAQLSEDAVVRKVVTALSKQFSSLSALGSQPQSQDVRQLPRSAPPLTQNAMSQIALQPQSRPQAIMAGSAQAGVYADVGNMRCWRCCFKGHLTRDCQNPPAAREDQEAARAESLQRKQYRDSLRDAGYAPRPAMALPPSAPPRVPVAVNAVVRGEQGGYRDWSAYDNAQAVSAVGSSHEGMAGTVTVQRDWTAYDNPTGAQVNSVVGDWFGSLVPQPWLDPSMGSAVSEEEEKDFGVHMVSLEVEAEVHTLSALPPTRNHSQPIGHEAELPCATLEEGDEGISKEWLEKCEYRVWDDINTGKARPDLSFTVLAQLSSTIRTQLQQGVASQKTALVQTRPGMARGPAVLPQVFTEVQGVLRQLIRVPAHSKAVGKELEENQAAFVHNAMLRQRTLSKLLMVHGIIRPLGDDAEWEISSVLIDSGGQINMINEKVVKKLELLRILEPGFVVTAFDGRRTAAAQYVTLPLRIAGVERLVEFYLVSGNTSYQLLLGMDWLTSTKCVVNFANRDMFIWGSTGRCQGHD